MNHLNSRYIQLKKLENELEASISELYSKKNSSAEQVVVLLDFIDSLKRLSEKVNSKAFPMMEDTIQVCNQYLACKEAINDYKQNMLLYDAGNKAQINEAIAAAAKNKEKLDDLKESYSMRHKTDINSEGKLCEAIVNSVERALKDVQNEKNNTIEDVKKIVGNDNQVELSIETGNSGKDTLPAEMVVARFETGDEPLDILRDLGISRTYQNLMLHLQPQGNMVIDTPYERLDDIELDKFALTYIIKVLECFPLGTVNIHVFGQNLNYLYKRIANTFQNEHSGESTKKIIQLHNDIKDLTKLRDVTCEDIFKKTSIDTPDLFAVYKQDRTDPFNIVIIRNGFVDGSGYAPAEILDSINSLSKPGDMGHKCGVRFLIFDNSSSYEKRNPTNLKYSIEQIRNNCELSISYDKGFTYEGKPIEVLHSKDNIEQFVQEKSDILSKSISNKERNYVPISDVYCDSENDVIDSILYIPIGKSGNDIVELPFSCKDERGTIAGQCIGYMAIGQSGSGKSSFFHSLVLNGCLKYSPRNLQFWLLDFKNGGASSKYSRSGLPHIKIIAENNKIDDALCLFQMVLEEMERRNKAFNNKFVDNIIDYNAIAEKEGIEYFPRIIIAIDEIQEIFRDDNASTIQKQISAISSRMRSAGMHFVMVAQNLSDGKSYMLKDAFLPSATGRICFRVSANIPRDSGFEDEFVQRIQEITELKTGEAYVSYGKGSIKRTKMAYASPQDMGEKYFKEIKEKYPEFTEMKPLVLGSKQRLTINSKRQKDNVTYAATIKDIVTQHSSYSAIVGEDAYRMEPMVVTFSQHDNSALLLLGRDKQIASSLCASITASLLQQNVEIHLFNGDKTKLSGNESSVPHAIMYVSQMTVSSDKNIHSHKLNELNDVLKDLYSEYLQRQKETQEKEDEDLDFSPLFLIVNDLLSIESFTNNDCIENRKADESTPGFPFVIDPENPFQQDNTRAVALSGQFRESVQSIVNNLLKNGWRYNIHFILSIRGDAFSWNNSRIISEVPNVILFNQNEFANQFENSYYLKEMLKNISNDTAQETMAVWHGAKNEYSKIRPIIYDLSNPQESESLRSLVEEK